MKPPEITMSLRRSCRVRKQVGKTQRLCGLRLIDELPRSAIGKVLKRELRETWAAGPA